MLRIIIDVLIAVGAFFAIAGTLGVLKMPDTFSRMQASTCITTMGARQGRVSVGHTPGKENGDRRLQEGF